MIIKDPFAKTTPLSWQTTPGEFKKRLSQNLKTVRVLPRYLYRVSGKWVSKGETQTWPTHGVGTGNGPLEEAPVGENCQASLSPGECLGTVELAREIPHKPCEQQPPPPDKAHNRRPFFFARLLLTPRSPKVLLCLYHHRLRLLECIFEPYVLAKGVLCCHCHADWSVVKAKKA